MSDLVCPICDGRDVIGVGMDDQYEDAPDMKYGVRVITRIIYFECRACKHEWQEHIQCDDNTQPTIIK